MQQNPPLSSSLPGILEVPSANVHSFNDDLTCASPFEWSDFLDYNLDEHLNISFPDHQQPLQTVFDQSQRTDDLGRVRKRDPRLVCSNFLAGRIPCACPELDEQLEQQEEEEELGGILPEKKRARNSRPSAGGLTRCQVPGCEADISELKGYHKRHRVCLQCANSTSVVLEGKNKRYCQQCGKFHILSDFDEGKRSCRRKLEWHNERRRKKANDTKGSVNKEQQQFSLVDDVSGDDDNGKDSICVSSQIEEGETLLESDAHASTLGSAPGSHHVQNDNAVSFRASVETDVDGEKHNPKFKNSPPYHEDKSLFCSVCPPGRISFKLYDWNPAEFPRRLRHQIFQWLSSMPIELEGYIRPGCTILTAFIAMPQSTWLKLLEEPTSCIMDLVASPRNIFSGRGAMLVYLNDMIFRVTKDATSVLKVVVKDRAPKLHYIYPTFFEAGRPIEFVACGSNLLQPKFRCLVSFAGRYLAYNISVSSLCCKKRDDDRFDHQLVKIYVPETDLDLFGPAFVEVENQSGLSNFIPILVGNKETCAEMKILQLKFNTPLSYKERPSSPLKLACEGFALRQARFSEFVLEVAWLLKKPVSKQKLTASHIQRFNHLLNFLIENESSAILEKVRSNIKDVVSNSPIGDVSDTVMKLLWKNMATSRNKLDQKLQEKDFRVLPTMDEGFSNQSSENDCGSVTPAANQDLKKTSKEMPSARELFPSLSNGTTAPLLDREVVVNVDIQERKSTKLNGHALTVAFRASRPLIVAVMTVAVCFGVCAVVLHPHRTSQIATAIRRSLFNHPLY